MLQVITTKQNVMKTSYFRAAISSVRKIVVASVSYAEMKAMSI